MDLLAVLIQLVLDFASLGFGFWVVELLCHTHRLPSELVFLVLVRYAYGFLDFLFTYNLH